NMGCTRKRSSAFRRMAAVKSRTSGSRSETRWCGESVWAVGTSAGAAAIGPAVGAASIDVSVSAGGLVMSAESGGRGWTEEGSETAFLTRACVSVDSALTPVPSLSGVPEVLLRAQNRPELTDHAIQ